MSTARESIALWLGGTFSNPHIYDSYTPLRISNQVYTQEKKKAPTSL